MVVQKALKRSWEMDNNPGFTPDKPTDDRGSVTSRLIYDIFGGEILKTHKKNGWHFYNRIDGKRVDFTKSAMGKSFDRSFEDIPTTPDEPFNYFEQEDYSTLFMRFIRAYEEVVGLKKSRHVSTG